MQCPDAEENVSAGPMPGMCLSRREREMKCHRRTESHGPTFNEQGLPEGDIGREDAPFDRDDRKAKAKLLAPLGGAARMS